MNRRRLLQALGLGALAPVLPNIPVAAAEPRRIIDPVTAVLDKQFEDPLYAIAFTEGPQGERYRHHMPATRVPTISSGNIVVEFTSIFTGTVRSVEIARGDNTLVTLYRDALDTQYWTTGALVRVVISINSNPTEAA